MLRRSARMFIDEPLFGSMNRSVEETIVRRRSIRNWLVGSAGDRGLWFCSSVLAFYLTFCKL